MSVSWKITADSTPVLDNWGWDEHWSAQDWMKWHSLVMQKYGRDFANQQFLAWWNRQTLGAGPLDARTFNATFRDYAKKHGFFSGLYGTVGGWIAKPLNWPGQVVGAADQVVTGATGGIAAGGKVLKYAVPAAIILILIFSAYYLYNLSKR